MRLTNHTLTLTTLLLAVATNATAADTADDPVTSLTKPDSSVSIGIGHVSGEREQFGIFDNLRGNDTMLLLDADVNKRDDDTGTWTTLRIRNLGIDNRSIQLGHDRQGDWGIGFDYSKIPYMAPYVVNSGVTGLGTESQTVPTITPGTGTNIVLGMERERIGLNVLKYLSPNLSFKASFKNEERDGNRHWGRGGQPEFAAEPIDSTSRILEAVLNYNGKQLQLNGGYIGNWYDNHKSLVTTINGAAQTYNLSLPFDNQAHQIFVNGGYSFTPTTRGTFRLSYTHATVDESIPPAIAALAWDGVGPRAFPAAPTRLDAAIDTTVVFLGLTARPMKNLNIVANLRYHEVNEKTPADLIVCRRCDDGNLANDQFVHSTPLDYKTLSGKLEGIYRLQKGYSLIAGIDIRNQDRTVPYGIDDDADGKDDERYVPFRAQLDEITYRIQLRKSMSETVNGAIAFLHSRRDGSTYSEAVHSEPGEGTAVTSIDPINIADRDRNKLRATVDWVPSERASLTFNAEAARDNYTGHALGLRDGNAYLVSVDASYMLSKDWQMTGWVSHDRNEAKQRNHRFASGSYSEAEMYDTLTDTGDSIGLGLTGTVNPKTKVGANLEWTRTRGEYEQNLVTSGAGTLYQTDTTGPLPDIENKVLKLSLFAEYALEKHADMRFDIVHERWRTNDWTWQFSDGSPFTYGTANDGTSVITDPHQSSTFVGVRYIYKFQ